SLLKLPQRTIFVSVNCAYAAASAFSAHCAHEPVVGSLRQCLILPSDSACHQPTHRSQTALNLRSVCKCIEVSARQASRHRSKGNNTVKELQAQPRRHPGNAKRLQLMGLKMCKSH